MEKCSICDKTCVCPSHGTLGMTIPKKESKMKTVHVVQEVVGGCAYEPVIFLNVKDADKHFIKLVNEVYHVDFTDIKEATEYVRDVESDDYHDIFYWELPLLERKLSCTKAN